MKILKMLTVAFPLLMACGCVKIWQDNLDIKTYMLQVERPGEGESVPMFGKLWIEDVHVLPPYNVRSLIVRESDVEFSTSYYSELLMSPTDNFRNLIFDWFSSAGCFKEVSTDDRKGMKYRLLATVMDFYGDRKTQKAVFRIKVSLFTESENVLMHKEYAAQIKSESNHAEDYIRAYNQATAEILTMCEQDVRAAISGE